MTRTIPADYARLPEDWQRDMLLREDSGHGRRGAQDDLFEVGE